MPDPSSPAVQVLTALLRDGFGVRLTDDDHLRIRPKDRLTGLARKHGR